MKLIAAIPAFLLTLFMANPAVTASANENNPEKMRVFNKLFPGKDIEEAHEELDKEFGNVPVSTMYDMATGMFVVDKAIETKVQTKEEAMEMGLQDAKAKGYEHLLKDLDRLQFYSPYWSYYESLRCMHQEDPGMWDRSVKDSQKESN